VSARSTSDVPRCLFITAGGPDLASSRCRVLQYLPLLERRLAGDTAPPDREAGAVGCELISCGATAWHRRLQRIAQSSNMDRARERRGPGVIVRAARRGGAAFCRAALEVASTLALHRALARVRQHDLVFLQKVVPPRSWQRRVREELGRPILFDFDDAIFLAPCDRRGLRYRDRLESLLRTCALVSTGSEFNRQYAQAFSRRVALLPTPVDVNRYRPALRRGVAAGAVTVGWIGSPATSRHLAWGAPALRRIAARCPQVRFHFVGARPLPGAEFRATYSPWGYETELQHLAGFHIGIMPLPPTDFVRGKAGYKLLQYMALGLPTVASPYGVNAEIIADGIDGLLAESIEQWETALDRLLADPPFAAALGAAAREKVVSHYSVEALFPRWRALLEEAANS
jgi:glycosyltransferase involved in cell wall biosynthesis